MGFWMTDAAEKPDLYPAAARDFASRRARAWALAVLKGEMLVCDLHTYGCPPGNYYVNSGFHCADGVHRVLIEACRPSIKP